MSMYPSHRTMAGGAPPQPNQSRLEELLDQIRNEFSSQTRTTEAYEHQSMFARGLPLAPWLFLLTLAPL